MASVEMFDRSHEGGLPHYANIKNEDYPFVAPNLEIFSVQIDKKFFNFFQYVCFISHQQMYEYNNTAIVAFTNGHNRGCV